MDDAPSRELIRFAFRRAQPNGRFSTWCRECGCWINATLSLLMKEYEGEAVYCQACSPCSSGSYGGSPQEKKDHAYHGGRFHSGEW